MGRKRAPLHGPTVAVLLATIVLAGCSAAPGSPDAAGASSVASSVAPSAGVATSPGASPSTASAPPNASGASFGPGASGEAGAVGSVADAAGDATPGYLDAVRMRAVARAGQLELVLTLAETVPASSVGVGTLAYDFSLDTDGDDTPDAVATLENVPEGGFRPVLANVATGHRAEGAEFPGTAGLAGAEVILSLALDAIDCPATVAVRASSARTRGGATTRDEVPETTASPLTVATGC